jgi:hypothetical protein
MFSNMSMATPWALDPGEPWRASGTLRTFTFRNLVTRSYVTGNK